MADKDRIKFLTGLLSKLNEKSTTSGQVYFAIDDVNTIPNAAKGTSAQLYFDVTTGANSVQRLPIYTQYSLKAGAADSASLAEKATKDQQGNTIHTTYISSLTKGSNNTSLIYKRPGGTNQTIDLAFLPLAGGTLTGAMTGTTITATKFVGPLNGNADTATKLANKRQLITVLDSTTGAQFDGSDQASIGVSGILPVANGGTGVSAIANIKAGKDADGNTISSTYLKRAGGEMTGSIKWYDNGKTVPFLEVGSQDKDTTILRIHHNASATDGSYGFSVKYLGTKNGNDNSLAIYSDNYGSKDAVKAVEILQDGSIKLANSITMASGKKFIGNLDGVADKATKDSTGAVISDTYLSDVYASATPVYTAVSLTSQSYEPNTYYTLSGTTYSLATASTMTTGTQYYSRHDKMELRHKKGPNAATSTLISTFVPLDSNNLINLQYLPRAALERVITVTNIAARNKLTINDVQLGDTVRVTNGANGKANNTLYIVVDTKQLGNDAGYAEYTAGTAASVAWSGIQGRPHLIGHASNQQAIQLNADKISYTVHVITANGGVSSYQLAPQFLPLAGGHVTGATQIDSLTAGDLLVNGSASFTNTIKGVIEKAVQLQTARSLKTVLDSESAASFNGTDNANIGVSGVLPIKHGGTGLSAPTANRLLFYSSGTALSQGHYIAASKIAVNQTSAPNENFRVNGTAAITGATTISGALTASSNVSVGGTLTTTGATTLKSILSVAGAGTFSSGLTVASTLTANGGIVVSTSSQKTSAYSTDQTATLMVRGGVSVTKQLSAATVRIDDGTANGNGCTLTYDDTHSCLEFVFS